jgi:hypothetical protein
VPLYYPEAEHKVLRDFIQDKVLRDFIQEWASPATMVEVEAVRSSISEENLKCLLPPEMEYIALQATGAGHVASVFVTYGVPHDGWQKRQGGCTGPH